VSQEELRVQSQITFLYYHNLEPVDRFYGKVMGFELVEDQGFARIYRVSDNAFVGVVTGERGFHRPQEKSAVLITFVVQDVYGWYDYLKSQSVKLLTGIKEAETIQVRGFFAEDPGGYSIEIQQFLNPKVARAFGAES